MKKFFILVLSLVSFSAMATPGLEFISVKERLRFLLWTEGLEVKKAPSEVKAKAYLPEELRVPLKKIEF